jgi:hypothetical protein
MKESLRAVWLTLSALIASTWEDTELTIPRFRDWRLLFSKPEKAVEAAEVVALGIHLIVFLLVLAVQTIYIWMYGSLVLTVFAYHWLVAMKRKVFA